MITTHYLNDKIRAEKQIAGQDQFGFLLTNRLGGYVWLGGEPSSRYQGWFFAPETCRGSGIVKIAENIGEAGSPAVTEITNEFWRAVRKRGGLREFFFMPDGFDALVYERDQEGAAEIVLDIRDINDHGEWDRNYAVSVEKGVAVVKFARAGMPVEEIFLAVKTGGTPEPAGDWIKRSYGFDRERNSPPDERYVYRALRCRSKKTVMAVSSDMRQAVREAVYVYNNAEELKKKKRKRIGGMLGAVAGAKKEFFARKTAAGSCAAVCAAHSLDSLQVPSKNGAGLYAGLPWFYQFWGRDTAFCLKALDGIDRKAAARIFWRQMDALAEKNYAAGSADEAGWLFKRAGELIERNVFSSAETDKIFGHLEEAIGSGSASRTAEGFVLNGAGETWMDSLPRAGARLEIQALRLNMCKLAAELSTLERSAVRYKKMEQELKKEAIRVFWNGKYLADGFEPESGRVDSAIRPNIFLAAYIYPGLLPEAEWVKCFKYVLPRLWCEWGGLASVDRDSADFHGAHTGENPASYHNGDSWFYVNNIAAIAMNRFGAKRFDFQIKKIFEAGTYDLLWSGILGHASELSSAQKFDSQGCPAQAWSAASYLELFREINNKPAKPRKKP